ILPMISLLPEETLAKLRARFGTKFGRLSEAEAQALVTAELEGSVSNQRLREMCDEHSSDITRILQGLVARGFLKSDGQGRWTTYRPIGDSSHKEGNSLHRDSPHKAGDSLHKAPIDSANKLDQIPEEALRALRVIAAPAFLGTRLPINET